MIQMTKSAEIRRAWERAGWPARDHPEVDKEYYFGSQTGDRVCLSCGEAFSWQDWRALEVSRRH